MTSMTGAEALVRSLEAEGVDTIFALPGVQVMRIFDAVQRSPSIRLIACRHEQTTTYAADGYARVTGRPGVALVVPGPGATNAAAGLGTAYATSSPVLLISGQIPGTALGKRQGQLHEVDDQLDLFRPLTKWNERITDLPSIPTAVHEAFRQMQTGRPRPVELEIPPDTLAATGDAEIIEAERHPSSSPEADLVETAARILSEAERPTIFAGGGVLRSHAGRALARVAEHLQAPVVTTQQARGVLPPDHPLYVGVNYSAIGLGKRALDDADIILAVGTRFLVAGFEARPGQRIVHIDADRDEIGKNHRAEVGIVADARTGLEALGAALDSDGPARAPDGRAASIRDAHQAFLREVAGEQLQWVEAVRAGLPSETVVVSGMTTVGYWSHVALDVPPEGTYITPGYFGTLGYAFPTAIGAKAGAPDRPVVALCGDGGFMYAAGELLTARRYGLNVTAVVFDNGAYGASRWDQRHRYGDREIGTEFLNPDWAKLGEALGVRTASTSSPAGLTQALQEAVRLDEPVLISVAFPLLAPPFQIVRS